MPKTVYPEATKKFGETLKYDPEFRGPNSRRSCTDIICLCLFLVFIVCWIIIGIFALTKGNSELLTIPKDSQGRRCGHDEGVYDKPYLLFFDLLKCVGPHVLIQGCQTPQICVSKCPDQTVIPVAGSYDKSRTLCIGNQKPNTYSEFDRAVQDGRCAKWTFKSEPVINRCLPTLYENISSEISVDSLRQAVKNIKYLAGADEVVTLVTNDLIQSWWKILLGLGGAMIICLIYIILMRYIADIMVWLSIVGVIVLLSVAVYMSAMKYKTLNEVSNATSENIWEQKNVWLGILIVSAILLIICLLLLLFLRKRILIAIALIREASKAVGTVTSTLFFPVGPWLVQVAVVAYAVLIGLYLASVGSARYEIKGMSGCQIDGLKDGDECNPDEVHYNFSTIRRTSNSQCPNMSCSFIGVEKPKYIQVFHAVNIIGAFWGVFFFEAFGEMVLAATFATWYWTFRKKDVPFWTLSRGMFVTLRYHLGTLAFGSLIITICRLIRVMIEYVDHKLKKYDNAFIRAMMCCCKCFFWCLEKFLKFINKNAYIMCAIHGRNFCLSAKDAFNLLMRNLVRVFVVDKVTDMLLFLAKILVTASVGVVAYTAFTNANFNMVNTEDLHYALVPVIFICIGTYFICSVFFGVYSMAVDTLFLCFLEDCERNDGSPEKPYFMSKELMRILGKRNKMK